jgi:hypothetical protein
MTDAPKPLWLQTDEEAVSTIGARYLGRFETLDFMDPETRSQLALDLGMLVGLALRLLNDRRLAAPGVLVPPKVWK